MSNAAKTCVVIPNWNGADMLGACLSALEKQTEPHVVMVVEQGSTDRSREILAKDFPKVRALLFDDNAGFAGGVNRGIRPAIDEGFEYIVLLNNDAVADREWLKNLVRAADEHPEAGIVTSKILRSDKVRLDSTGDFYTSWGFAYPRGRDEEDHGQFDDEANREIFGGSGGASLYRASMLKKIGLFDEAFFAYFEDIDISFRAQLAGYKVIYEPSARVYHEVSATTNRMKSNFARYHTVKNFVFLYTKNMPGRLYWKYLPKVITAYGMYFVRDVTKHRSGTFFSAAWAATRKLPVMFSQRRKIQRSRAVSVDYIDSIIQKQMPPTQRKVLGLKQRLGRVK
jgi:GT2 family glycosyltransferase